MSTTPDLIIEPWSESNVGYVVQLIRELVTLSVFGVEGPDFNWRHTLEISRRIMLDPKHYLRLASIPNGDGSRDYCGIVGGHMEWLYFSPTPYAMEDAWFVRDGTPERTKIAVALMRGFMEWAKEHNAYFVQTGDIASINSMAVAALYGTLGFHRFGSIFRYVERT